MTAEEECKYKEARGGCLLRCNVGCGTRGSLRLGRMGSRFSLTKGLETADGVRQVLQGVYWIEAVGQFVLSRMRLEVFRG